MNSDLSASDGLSAAILSAEAGLRALAADPVAAFRFKSEAQRRFAKSLSQYREVYLRSGNQAGKTTIGAFCGVALARGKSELDGVALPLLGAPNVGLVLAKGRAMAKESVIKAYRLAVGKWPHHLEKNGNAIEAIWVKPDRGSSDDWADWSCIRFFVEDGQSLAGMRLDWAHADEPPKEEAWRELRMRGKANRHFVRFITATPLDKREWKWLRDDFKGCDSASGGKDGKVELRMSVFDNKALGQEHLAAIEKDSAGPLQQAKLFGDYIDLTGTNPFDAAGLKRWAERAIDPLRVEKWTTGGGAQCDLEVYADLVTDEQYLVVADPSAGIWDEQGEHDPCEVVVVSRGVKGRPAVVARYNGYIPAYELGRLSTHLARRYAEALLVWERNGGYGEAFHGGTDGYGNVYIEHHHDSLRLPLSERIGWLTTATSRGTVIGALQKAVLEDGLYVPSRAAISSLEDVVLDKRGRIEAGAGSHDEDMIVLGLACHLLETYPLYKPEPKSGKEVVVEALTGRKLMPRYEPDPFSF